MKVKVLGTELLDANIEFVSLVKRGAIRAPWKIIKMEDLDDLPEIEEKEENWYTKAAKKAFGNNSEPENDEKVGISAIFVQKDALERVLPLLKEAGFEVDKENIDAEDDVIMFKLEGFEGVGSLFALSSEVGVATDRVVKFFDPFLSSEDFNDNIGTAFFPSLGMAQDALGETIFNVLQSANDDDEASAGIKKALSSFSRHVNKLARALPEEVFKLEKSLKNDFEGITFDNSENSDSLEKEETQMTDIKEVVPGDLDGLDNEVVEKSEDATEQAAEVEKGEPEIEVKLGNRKVLSETGEVEEQEYKYQLDADGNEIFMGIVAKEEEEEAAEEVKAEAEEEVAKEEESEAEAEVEKEEEVTAASEATDVESDDKFNKLLGAIQTLADVVKEQSEKIAEVAKTAEEAKETAENTVVATDSLAEIDESFALSSMGASRQIQKGEQSDDLWNGVMPELNVR